MKKKKSKKTDERELHSSPSKFHDNSKEREKKKTTSPFSNHDHVSMQIPRRDLSSNAQTAEILKEMKKRVTKKENSNEWIQYEKKIDP